MHVPHDHREVAKGVHWLGDCVRLTYRGDQIHSHMSCFLIVGDNHSLLIDTGHPSHWPNVERGLDAILGDRPLDLVLPTHSEMPHAGNLPRLLTKYPTARVVGDVRDYHLFYPALADRLDPTPSGEELDLGATGVVVLPALWRDLPSTVWAYETRSRVLFVADGFCYVHYHQTGHCTLTSSELPQPPDIEQTMFVNERGLIWTRFGDVSTTFAAVDQLLDTYPPALIAPAHGGVIDNPAVLIPILKAGMVKVRERELERH